MKKLLALIVTVTFSTAAFAGTPVKILKGQTYTATEDSWVFSTSDELAIRNQLIEADFNKQQVSLLKANIDTLNSQIVTYQTMSDKYRKAWMDSDSDLTKTLKYQNKSNFIYLGLGVLLTIGAGFAVGQASK